jgi:FKBP-type peptidyl-prolyl cis-trans isomerase 2
MKKYVFFFLSLTLLASCTGTKPNTEVSTTGSIEIPSVQSGVVNSPKTETSTWVSDGVVKAWSKVSVTYTGTLDDGSIFDASSRNGGKPLEFTVGAGMMIPGFDKGVLGMKKWETKKLVIEAKDAYGEVDPKRTETVKKSVLKDFEEKGGIKLVAGAKLPTQRGVFTIKEVKGDDVTVDLNHELAGKKLSFEVKIESIQ